MPKFLDTPTWYGSDGNLWQVSDQEVSINGTTIIGPSAGGKQTSIWAPTSAYSSTARNTVLIPGYEDLGVIHGPGWGEPSGLTLIASARFGRKNNTTGEYAIVWLVNQARGRGTSVSRADSLISYLFNSNSSSSGNIPCFGIAYSGSALVGYIHHLHYDAYSSTQTYRFSYYPLASSVSNYLSFTSSDTITFSSYSVYDSNGQSVSVDL